MELQPPDAKKPKLSDEKSSPDVSNFYTEILPDKLTTDKRAITTNPILNISSPEYISMVISLVKPILSKSDYLNHLKLVNKDVKTQKVKVLIPSKLHLTESDENENLLVDLLETLTKYGEIENRVEVSLEMPITAAQAVNANKIWPTKFKPSKTTETLISFRKNKSIQKILEIAYEIQRSDKETNRFSFCSQKVKIFDRNQKCVFDSCTELSEAQLKILSTVDLFRQHKLLLSIRAFTNGKQEKGTYLLNDKTVLLDIEPCSMCAMALLHSRVANVIFNFRNPKFGSLISKMQMNYSEKLNHKFNVLCLKS